MLFYNLRERLSVDLWFDGPSSPASTRETREMAIAKQLYFELVRKKYSNRLLSKPNG